jgi:hypothetical protein
MADGWDQGYALGDRAYERVHAHKQALTDQEHDTLLQNHNDTIASLQQKLGATDPNDPNYGTLQNQLNSTVQSRTALFHPNQPGGLARLGKMLWEKVHGPTQGPQETDQAAVTGSEAMPNVTPVSGPPTKNGPTENVAYPEPEIPGVRGSERESSQNAVRTQVATPDTPGAALPLPAVSHPIENAAQAKAKLAQILQWGAPGARVNPLQQWRKDYEQAVPDATVDPVTATQIHAGVDARPIAEKPEGWKVNGQPYKGADGKWYQHEINAQGEGRENAMDENYNGPQAHQSSAALQTYLRSLYGDSPTPKQIEEGTARYEKLVHGDTSGTHEVQDYDEHGNLIIVPLHSSSKKTFGVPGEPPSASPVATSNVATPRVAPAAAAPQTAGLLKQRAAAAAAKVPAARSVDRNINDVHKNTPFQAKAQADMDEATTLTSMADHAKTGTAEQQRLFLNTLQRTVDKRYNAGAFENLTSEYGIGNAIERFFTGNSTGKLPQDVMDKLVEATHSYLSDQKAGLDRAYGRNAVTPVVPNAGQSKGRRSLKAAMGLDVNKGKSEQDVRDDLAHHGYEVAP